jgi:histidinol-phosphate aminotransferase
MTLPQPKPWVLDIPVYEPGKSQVRGATRVIKLSSNEAALGPSPKATTAYNEAAATLYRYPPGDSGELRAAVAEVHDLDPARIICGAGSDEIIGLLCRAFAGPGDEVIYTAHGFMMYPIYALGVGAKPVAVPERDLTADVDAILGAVTPRTKLVFLANPNNPTGTYINAAALLRLRNSLREDVVLMVDEAYAEFVDADDYQSGLTLAATTPNTIVLRTFSKIYGLAALRVGWGFGPKAIIDAMERFRGPFNVSRAAQVAAAAAVRDRAHVARAKDHNTKWRKIALQRLRGLGLKVGDSAGNFVLPEFPTTPGRTAADADAFLQSQGLIVRRVDNYGLPQYLRITIGNDEEMTTILDALTVFMEQGRG